MRLTALLWGWVLISSLWMPSVGPLQGATVELYRGHGLTGGPYATVTSDAEGYYSFDIDPETEGWHWTLTIPGYWHSSALGDRSQLRISRVEDYNEGSLPHYVEITLRSVEHVTYSALPVYAPLIIGVMSEPTLTPTINPWGTPTPFPTSIWASRTPTIEFSRTPTWGPSRTGTPATPTPTDKRPTKTPTEVSIATATPSRTATETATATATRPNTPTASATAEPSVTSLPTLQPTPTAYWVAAPGRFKLSLMMRDGAVEKRLYTRVDP